MIHIIDVSAGKSVFCGGAGIRPDRTDDVAREVIETRLLDSLRVLIAEFAVDNASYGERDFVFVGPDGDLNSDR